MKCLYHINQSSKSIHISYRVCFHSINTDHRVHAMGWGWRSKYMYKTSSYSNLVSSSSFFSLCKCILILLAGRDSSKLCCLMTALIRKSVYGPEYTCTINNFVFKFLYLVILWSLTYMYSRLVEFEMYNYVFFMNSVYACFARIKNLWTFKCVNSSKNLVLANNSEFTVINVYLTSEYLNINKKKSRIYIIFYTGRCALIYYELVHFANEPVVCSHSPFGAR